MIEQPLFSLISRWIHLVFRAPYVTSKPHSKVSGPNSLLVVTNKSLLKSKCGPPLLKFPSAREGLTLGIKFNQVSFRVKWMKLHYVSFGSN